MKNSTSLSFGAKRSLYENLLLDWDYRKTEMNIDFKSQREYQLYVLKSFFESNEDMFRMISDLKHDVGVISNWLKFEKMSMVEISDSTRKFIHENELMVKKYNELIDFIESNIILA